MGACQGKHDDARKSDRPHDDDELHGWLLHHVSPVPNLSSDAELRS